MGISIDINRALTSESYAAQCIRSGQLSSSDRSQIAAQWGADKIKLWESVDSTQYRIDDEDWGSSQDAGRKKAEEATGHDGSKESVLRVGADAALSLGGAFGAVAPSLLGKGIQNGLNAVKGRVVSWTSSGSLAKGDFKLTQNVKGGAGDSAVKGAKGEKNLGDIATIVLTAAVALKYRLDKSNEEQHEAAMKLYNAAEGTGVLAEGQCSLSEAQEVMQEATEETTALTEEADALNEDANSDIDDYKTNFDYYRKEYERLKAKAASGEELTPDELQLVKKLAPMMQEAADNISAIQDDTSTALEDTTEKIESFQSSYDDGAETIAEVQGVTDFAEGFDSATRTMAYIEGVSQGINGASAGVAAGRLAAKSGLGFWALAPLIATGAATAISSAAASAEQFKWAGEVGDEIDYREQTQELGVQTEDVYNTELDNFAGNIDIIDDLEIVVPEDTEIPQDSLPLINNGTNNVDPLASGAAGQNVNNDDSKPNAEKPKPEDIKDPNVKDEDEK